MYHHYNIVLFSQHVAPELLFLNNLTDEGTLAWFLATELYV